MFKVHLNQPAPWGSEFFKQQNSRIALTVAINCRMLLSDSGPKNIITESYNTNIVVCIMSEMTLHVWNDSALCRTLFMSHTLFIFSAKSITPNNEWLICFNCSGAHIMISTLTFKSNNTKRGLYAWIYDLKTYYKYAVVTAFSTRCQRVPNEQHNMSQVGLYEKTHTKDRKHTKTKIEDIETQWKSMKNR